MENRNVPQTLLVIVSVISAFHLPGKSECPNPVEGDWGNPLAVPGVKMASGVHWLASIHAL
jgi:hypothetical protein